jgi:hypothetical protein
MKSVGIKKKALRVQNAPQKKTLSLEVYGDQIVELDDRLDKIVRDGSHLLWLDEVVFSARSYEHRRAWSNLNENVHVEDRSRYQPCQAVCAAVCACHGIYAIR